VASESWDILQEQIYCARETFELLSVMSKTLGAFRRDSPVAAASKRQTQDARGTTGKRRTSNPAKSYLKRLNSKPASMATVKSDEILMFQPVPPGHGALQASPFCLYRRGYL